MAISLDSSSMLATTWTSASSISWSHTCSGNANTFLIVVLNDGDGTGVAPTSVTYNSVAMTQLAHYNDASAGDMYIYGLASPSSGSNTIKASWAASHPYLWGAAESLLLASSSQPDSSNSGDAAGAVTVSTSVVAANSWLVGISSGGASKAAGTNTYLRENGTDNTACVLVDSNGTVGSGSHSLQVTEGANTYHQGLLVVSIAPYVAPTNPSGIPQQAKIIHVL